MAKKAKKAKKTVKRRGPNMHGVVREIKKVITATKRTKALAPKQAKLKKLLTSAESICDDQFGFYLV